MDRRRRVSMREVAELADVAISSVSRVLSEHPDVSDEMRTRVLEAVARLEYEPDFLAQSLRRGETRSVGFVVADISNPLFASVALGRRVGPSRERLFADVHGLGGPAGARCRAYPVPARAGGWMA